MDRGPWNEGMMRTLVIWHWTRWLRLGVAGVFLAQGFHSGDGLALAIGALLAWQGLFNVGCSSSGQCAMTNDQITKGSALPVIVEKKP